MLTSASNSVPVCLKDSIDTNLSLEADVARTSYGNVTLDLRVNNLFNSVLNDNYVSAAQPWQLGRNAWVSVKFRY